MSNKPDSVTFEKSKVSYHLSKLPTPPPDPPVDGYTFRVERFKRIVDIHGISIRKVYPVKKLLSQPVRSYRTFSPLSASLRTVIFCDTVSSEVILSHLLNGAIPDIVRTFLSGSSGAIRFDPQK